MVWAGANDPQEYPDPGEEHGPTDDVLELREQVADLTARLEAMEAKVNSITVGPGGALYAGGNP